jgi:phosphatidylserine/phosphatidylglycerophosphate/cardiolipin synthase-like enzyme
MTDLSMSADTIARQPNQSGASAAVRVRPTERLVIDAAERYRTFLETIDAASHTLDLSIFRCDDPAVIQALAGARARGVRVRVLLTNRAKGGRRQLAWLQTVLRRLEIAVARYDGSCRKYHAKYALVDGTHTLISTMNLTRDHFADTDDLLFTSTDSSIQRSLGAMFDADWAGKSAPLLACDRLIVSPDNARARMMALIASAHHSIVIVDHKLADVGILDELVAAQARGVDIHLLTDRTRRDVRAHGKAMILDGRRAVIGSLALSKGTLNRRRDVAVIVDTPELVQQIAAHIPPLHLARSLDPPLIASCA